MEQQFKSLEENFQKIMNQKDAVLKGNNTAGTRVRAMLQEIKTDAQILRASIQADKNKRKAERKA
jgi:hypothetical protein